MSISITMQGYLEDNHIRYDAAKHARTGCSMMTAHASHVPGGALAKGVVLKWDDGYVLAVLPASRHVDLARMREIIGDKVRLASEEEASSLFPDCDEGAVPILGVPYRVCCVVDEQLRHAGDVYFEGGDHRTLVHVTGDEFSRLMYGMPQARISW